MVTSSRHQPAPTSAKSRPGGRPQAEAEIAAAAHALERSEWTQNMRLRAAILFAAADRMEQRAPELALLLAIETGKPIRVARGEIAGHDLRDSLFCRCRAHARQAG